MCSAEHKENVYVVVRYAVNTVRKQEATCLNPYTHDACSISCKDVPTMYAPTTGTSNHSYISCSRVTLQFTVLLLLAQDRNKVSLCVKILCCTISWQGSSCYFASPLCCIYILGLVAESMHDQVTQHTCHIVWRTSEIYFSKRLICFGNVHAAEHL